MHAPPTLATARLRLRPFTAGDVADLFGVRGDREAMRHWDWPHDEDVDQTRQAAETMLCDMQAQASWVWTARLCDGRFAGVFDLSALDQPVADLGFLVPARLWGTGYGAEGAAAVVGHAWARGLPAVGARTHADNVRSARLLTRLGFVETGCGPVEVRPGVTVACRRYRLTRPDGVCSTFARAGR